MSIVLDASALLAVILDESGASAVISRMDGAMMSSVNLAEIYGRLVPNEAEEQLLVRLVSHLTVAAFDSAQARDAGMLRPGTKTLGLSLGDRACLALARRERALILTSDFRLSRAKVGVDIQMIR